MTSTRLMRCMMGRMRPWSSYLHRHTQGSQPGLLDIGEAISKQQHAGFKPVQLYVMPATTRDCQLSEPGLQRSAVSRHGHA